MNKSELARNLGISRQMVYKLEKRGMPTSSLEAARAWRGSMFNFDHMQSKQWRIDGNLGIKRKVPAVVHDFNLDDIDITLEVDNVDIDSSLNDANVNFPNNYLEREVLTEVMPALWFEQVGWLGSVLKDHDIKITVEQLIKVQQALFMIYMETVTEYLEEDEIYFKTPPILKAIPGDEIYPSLIERLNQILDAETAHQNQS